MNDPAGPSEGQPKIIIDDDWKAQARREKEKLAAKEREAAAKAPAPKRAEAGAVGGVNPGEAGSESEEQGDPIEMGFKELVGTFVMQALLYLGGIPDPQTGRAVVSLEHARFNIEMLMVLEHKTKGNLNEVESTELTQALAELRSRFVEVSRAVAQMQAKQAAAAATGGGVGGGAGAGGPGQPIAGMPNLRLRNE
ncbi:MAG: DUF1844 domain-containing protein [Phycisphaerales bacterium]|nr:DUF1844 domain-containing protein [Phycisphaerales bacterium]